MADDIDDIFNFNIEGLGECTIPSPVLTSKFTPDNKRVLFNIGLHNYNAFMTADGQPLSLEVAGPREKVYFDPVTTKAAIVTCRRTVPRYQ